MQVIKKFKKVLYSMLYINKHFPNLEHGPKR